MMRNKIRDTSSFKTTPPTISRDCIPVVSNTESESSRKSQPITKVTIPSKSKVGVSTSQNILEDVKDNSSHCDDNALHILSLRQVQRLDEVMNSCVKIHSRVNGYPIVSVCLKSFILEIRRKLAEEGVELKDVRLTGGTASYVLSEETIGSYNDYDFLFSIQLPTGDSGKSIHKVKSATLNALRSFGDTKFNAMSSRGNFTEFQETYIQKLFRIIGNDQRGDCWSLISLGKPDYQEGRKSIDIKFVHHMKRVYEFSVDSFQIILDSLLTFYGVTALPLTECLYPTVVAESATGDFQESWNHLQYKFISTRNPEEIHGGGLLKYCRLLVDGYHAATNIDIAQMEKYMCSRFFIDHMDVNSQRARIVSYINDHFPEKSSLRVHYLQILQNVIWNSTICLMNQERASVMQLIESLIAEVQWSMTPLPTPAPPPPVAITELDPSMCSMISYVHQNDIGGNEWICDGVYYGASHFPIEINPYPSVMGYTYMGNWTPLSYNTVSVTASSGFSSMSPVDEASPSLLSYTSSQCPSPSNEGSSTSESAYVAFLSEKTNETPQVTRRCKHSQGVTISRCCTDSITA